MKKICFVTAIPMTIEAFLIDYIRKLSGIYSISVITNTDNVGFLKAYGLDTEVISIPIERDISLLKDIIAFLKLYFIFCKERFHSVHSVTPKAGLLSMCASFLAKVPVRIHTFTGQVWATKKGITRCFLKNMDKIIVRCATHILVDSQSQREFIIKEKVVSPNKAHIIGHGSISGVDTERFSFNSSARDNIRKDLGIQQDDFVFLFIGRLNRDKGILDLIEAFSLISKRHTDSHLLIVGPDEEGIKNKIMADSKLHSEKIHLVGLTKEPEKYMSASDCLCLPSYREGFGLVIIEAASIGIPAIGSRIYGITDAIEEGSTGLLHETGNIEELAKCMEWVITHREERLLMGKRARERANSFFSKEKMNEEFKNFYREIIGD